VIGDYDENGDLTGYLSLQPLPGGKDTTYRYTFELTDKKGNVFFAER